MIRLALFVAFASLAAFSAEASLSDTNQIFSLANEHLELNGVVKLRKKRDDSAVLKAENDSVQECALECVEALGRDLDEMFHNHNASKIKSKPKEVLDDYSPAEFEKLCQAYRPRSKCLAECPDADLMKKWIQRTLQFIEDMCVTRYDDFKKYLPCINKIGKENQKVCEKQCGEHKDAFDKLDTIDAEGFTKNSTNITELRDTFRGSCLYAQCNMDCASPITEKACGKEAANLEKGVVRSTFSAVSNLVDLVGEEFNFWPKECRALGRPG